MRARTAVLVTFTAGAATAAAVWWRRRRTSPSPSPVQIGLDDGSVHALPADDPALAELDTLAAAVRHAFESAG